MTAFRKTASIGGSAGRLVSTPPRRWCISAVVISVLVGLFVANDNLARAWESFLHADWWRRQAPVTRRVLILPRSPT